MILEVVGLVPGRWPLAQITYIGPCWKRRTHSCLTVKTATGTYKQSITKIALLLPSETSENCLYDI